jgi:hypothetical protein
MTLATAAARPFLLTGIALALAFPCDAQTAKETPAARTVKIFNVFCLSQLPDLDGVAKAAGFGEFAPITGDELKAHTPDIPTDALYAWRFHEAGGEFILTAGQSKPDDKSKKEAPAFANAKRFACTLTFPPADARQVVAELNALLKRQPSGTSSEGGASVHTWTHATAKHLSRVEFHSSSAAAPGQLSASVLAKP